jgi:NAD(P)-dependent dehydrogenase (short-subunit alcohol dehydrogenase family)
MADKKLEGRVALVTGASRGIGWQVALGLAREGAHVIALARTSGALEELDDEIKKEGGSATLVPLDLRDFEAYGRLAQSIDERWGRLDILVANAGSLGILGPLNNLQPKAWLEAMDVNVNASWMLIRTLDPLLQKSDAGRAIFVTSGAAARPIAYWGPYCVSKAALNMLAQIYAQENDKTALNVNLINPGPMRTAMRARAFPGEDPDTLAHPREIVPLFLELADPACTRNGEIVNFQS